MFWWIDLSNSNWKAEVWKAVGGGGIVDIRHVDIHRIAPYITKYLATDVLLAPFKHRQRRYSTSRDITLSSKMPSGRCCLLKTPIELALGVETAELHGTVLRGSRILKSFVL
jgi:hypothetical protein